MSRRRFARRVAAASAAVWMLAAGAAAAAPVRVRMVTGDGPLVLELYPDQAPRTVANFLAYLDRGLWKGASFYRSVSPANDHNPAAISVVQGGLDRNDAPLPPVPHESTRDTGLRHTVGAISMARGAPGTAGDDFFICTADDPALDYGGARNPDGQGFAAFGRVVEGMEVVRRIHDAPLASGGADPYTRGQRLAQPVPILEVARVAAPPAPGSMAGGGMAMDMPGMAAPQGGSEPGAKPGMEMSGMSMPMGATMQGALGAYPMTRDASGTAWQPDSTPMEGLHARLGGWTTMLHGYATLAYDDQGGGRGDTKTFVESMLMGMAQRPLGGGVLTLRAMLSADPFMGKRGYPLLLATGETANGRDPLVDRQHPHDAVMELAGVYSHEVARGTSAFFYLGWPGEPALGPATYMHRFSGMSNPEAPIDHHWLDSTHITFGVATAGLVRGPFKLEASSFTGREPNQYRWDFDHPRFDSWSARLTVNPTPDLTMQVSYGFLKSPEQLEPDVDQRRTTASATYNRRYDRGNWQTTLAWGRDANDPGMTLDAYLVDTAASFDRHTVFGRFENADKDELFDLDEASLLHGRAFNVSKFSLGYFYTAPIPGRLALDFGGLVSKFDLPSALTPAYGASPTSFLLFTRVKLR